MIFLGFMHFKVSFAADSDGWKKQLLVCSILDGLLVTNNDRLFHQSEEVNRILCAKTTRKGKGPIHHVQQYV